MYIMRLAQGRPPHSKKKSLVNIEIYIADLKATTCISAKLFLLRCVNPAALPLVRCYSFPFPGR